MAILDALTIARSGLLANQRALGVTGSNVANVNTPGYARQRAVLEPLSGNGGYGVRVAAVEQLVDRFLDVRGRERSSALAGATAQRDLYARVEGFFPVDGPSVGSALQDFFAAASDLSTQPEDIAVRNELLDRAEALAGRIRAGARELATVQREVDERVVEAVREANSLLDRIARLNGEIVARQAAGTPPNELLDQRRSALDDLARKLDVRTVERDNGTVDVFLRTGAALVLGADPAGLATGSSTTLGLDGAPLTTVGLRGGDGGVIALPGPFGGEVGALLEARDAALVDDAADLDELAVALRDAVNGVQADPAARDLDGLAGEPLFAGSGAADLVVAITDPRRLAAALSASPSDNSNALALVALQSAAQPALSGARLGDFWGSLQARAGGRSRDAADAATVEENLSAAVEAQRQAVSGVNLEEELTDLIRFQRGFQASAQLMAVSDRLLDDLLGLVR